MNLFIPPLGTEITLAEPWTFNLYFEYRNFSAMEFFGVTEPESKKWDYYREERSEKITLPAGTLLKVDRIYIRKGARDFDSVTFYMKGGSKVVPFAKGKPKAIRFWAKLPEVNKIIIQDIP